MELNMKTFGEDLIQSLGEALAHAKGEGPAIVQFRRIAARPHDVLEGEYILCCWACEEVTTL